MNLAFENVQTINAEAAEMSLCFYPTPFNWEIFAFDLCVSLRTSALSALYPDFSPLPWWIPPNRAE